jgi:hypothetical protein
LKKIIYTRNSHILREINKIVIKDQDVIWVTHSYTLYKMNVIWVISAKVIKKHNK